MLFILHLLVVLVSLFSAGLGVFVLVRNPRGLAHRAFFAFTALIAVWVPANYFGSVVRDEWLAQLLIKTDFASGFALMVAFFLLTNEIGRPLIRRINITYLAVPLAAVMTALVFLDQVVLLSVLRNGVMVSSAVLGDLYDALILALFAGGFIVLTVKRQTSVGVVRAQITIVLCGLIVMVCAVVPANILVPKLTDNLDVHNLAQRMAYLGLVFFNVTVTYAMVKHRLFDARWLAARSVTYLILLSTLALTYGLAVFTMTRLYYPSPQFNQRQIILMAVLAVLLAATFHPLRRFLDKITDRFFFRDRYDPQAVINNVSNILATERLLGQLLDQSLRELCHHLRVAGARVVVLEDGRVYDAATYGAAGRQPRGEELTGRLHDQMIVADELEAGPLKQLLDDHGVRVSLMLWTQDKPVGFLFLGEKLSGNVYSHQDLTLLEIVRKELSVAVVNAKAYQEIAAFNVTLQQEVQKATARLRAANDRLQVLDKAKDEFISMASHQLGTPLTAVTGFLTMALDEDKRNMTAPQREYVESALEAGERLQAMAADLLNASQMSAERFFIQPEPTNLGRIVADEVKQLRPAAERKDLKLVYAAPRQPVPPLMLDAVKTRHVVMNLIDNAIFYTHKGSITVSLAADEGVARLTVTDTGIGVPRREQSRLFTRFYRAKNAKQVRPDGTGLGLYLAKRVIEDQGGSIIFQSTPGQGSTFGFTLPLNRS